MKKRISEFIFFSLFCFLLIFCIRLLFIFLKDKFNYENNQLYYLLTSFLLVFWLAGISYGKLWSMRASRKQIIAVSIGWLLLWLCLFTFLPAVKEARRFHEQVFADHIRAMHGRAYMKDDTLGLKAIPGAECKEMYTVGEPLQINYDERGYRIPAEGDSLCDPGTAPQLLFLGCSFTFGAGVPAEETYPYKVAHQTNIPYLNTGLGSYGLAHMYVLARRLIPLYKPRYVIIQYSPWLVQRATSIYGPSQLGRLPFPYFYKQDNSFKLATPVYDTRLFSIDKVEIRKRYKNRPLAFYFLEGLPFFIHDNWQNLKARLAIFFGRKPKPTREYADVERFAYGEIIRLVREYGGQPIILQLGEQAYTNRAPNLFSQDQVFANADSLINLYIANTPTGDFDKEYYIWRNAGTRRVMIDRHPNSRIHDVIAESIINQIE